MCKDDMFAFQKLTDGDFFASIVKDMEINEGLNLRVTPTETLKTLFNDFSNNNVDEPSPIKFGYYDLSNSIPNSNNCNLSMFHLNIASLGLHKEELVTSLSLLDFDFVGIAITYFWEESNFRPISHWI